MKTYRLPQTELEASSVILGLMRIPSLTDAEIREILDGYNEAVVAQIVPIVEAEIRNGTADPITDDIHGLVRTLVATTGFTLSGEVLDSSAGFRRVIGYRLGD